MNNLLVAQSGGPTSVINATMAGIVDYAKKTNKIDKIYGGLHGIKGIIGGQLIEIHKIFSDNKNLNLLTQTPSSALGSSRYKLKDDKAIYEKIIDVLKRFGIGYFIYIGGNDSMDTVLKLSNYCRENSIDDIKIMGVPKTIDNDLYITDHTPGFGSAAKYIATTTAELFCDLRVYDMPLVGVLEIMGRNAGWLTASAALSGVNGGDSPNLIYIPEVEFDEDKFIEDVKKELAKTHYVLIALSEGLKDSDGVYLCEKTSKKGIDAFGHKMLSGAGKYVEQLIKSSDLGCRTRGIELSLMQRAAGHIVSLTDIEESKLLGAKAVERALEGYTAEMSIIIRESSNPYKVTISSVDVAKVANFEKTVPLEWLNEEKNNVNEKMIEYIYPLIQGEYNTLYENGIPKHIKLF
ncbi:MAG: 6-phosphofructokinase [Oscillospiraceae bacterium]|nr:6-phosphofructokinase [Oscillospiraceae bacterium]